jgi:hypothetical protein
MQKQYDVCTECNREFKNMGIWDGRFVCHQCFTDLEKLEKLIDSSHTIQVKKSTPMFKKVEFNKPEHYHTHDIDTIEFLKRGFPPQVLTGFLIGNIIKYTQRFEYKNGEDDVLKIVDYAKRLEEWYKETHS